MYNNATSVINGAAITPQDAQIKITPGHAHYALVFIYTLYAEHIKTIPSDRRADTAKDHTRQFQNPAQLQNKQLETC